jgi:replicative DNA helicase
LIADLDAERTVIGAMVTNPESVAVVGGLLKADDFSTPVHRSAFRSIMRISDKGRQIDMISVRRAMEDGDGLAPQTTANFISGVLDGLPFVDHIETWADIVLRKSIARQLAKAASSITEKCKTSEDSSELIDHAMSEVLKVSERSLGGEGFAHPSVAAKSANQAFDTLLSAVDGITGLCTGISVFDAMTGGMKPHNLIVIAGRPGMGKSAAGITIADNVAAAGKRVAFFSLEMSRDELTMRRWAKKTGISPRQIDTKTEENKGKAISKFQEVYGDLETDQLYIDDTPALTVNQIRVGARKLAAEAGGIDLVVVDYLQLIRGERFENRQQEIASIARALKNLAKELNVPMLALSQLNRQVESRENKRPGLADLRESGEIEQAADVILFLYRPWVYDQKEDPRKSDWIVSKQRDGRTGTMAVAFEPELTYFHEEER